LVETAEILVKHWPTSNSKSKDDKGILLKTALPCGGALPYPYPDDAYYTCLQGDFLLLQTTVQYMLLVSLFESGGV
jgi:hypothetical protein